MSATPGGRRDRRAERAAATRREILDAAWDMVRADGLAAMSMRPLAERVGMQAQSLYVYFPSKHAIYEAMFEEANHELLARKRAIGSLDGSVDALRRHARVFLEFCVEDPVRYQLLFQRTIPAFEPSPASYAVALEVLEDTRTTLDACGISDPAALDAWTALMSGIAAQQIANQPGGDRWLRLTDRLVDMYLETFVSTRGRTERDNHGHRSSAATGDARPRGGHAARGGRVPASARRGRQPRGS